jgi:hypothetical protein
MNCPQCGKQVFEKDLYCPGCGTKLEKVGEDSQSAAWIAAMQERIKYARQQNLVPTIFTVMGAIAIIASSVKIILEFETTGALQWDLFWSVIQISGGVVIIAGGIGLWLSDKKIRKLIDRLEKGK